MKVYWYVRGDRPNITFIVQRNGSAVDLTDYGSVTFVMKADNTSVATINAACTGLNATGECTYQVNSTGFATAGNFVGRLKLTTNSMDEHTQQFNIKVEAF